MCELVSQSWLLKLHWFLKEWEPRVWILVDSGIEFMGNIRS